MTYYLYRLKKNNRVVLDNELPKEAVLIDTIEASSWIAARMKVSELAYDYVSGHGYF